MSAQRVDVTYYTVADEGFFLGTVMLLNSLRVTGNAGDLVVLDTGLTPEQRTLLERHAEVVALPRTLDGSPVMMKPYPYLFDAAGTVVVIDSDIIVTSSLEEPFRLGRAGKIVATPAWAEDARRRWFPEWEETLRLRAPLRREEWFHNGFVVFSTDHWPHLLERWWELCERVPPEQAFVDQMPFNAPDADALNALLMSEIPRHALALLPRGDEAFGGDVVIEDVTTLRCTLDGRPTLFLHYPDSPKPWQRRGWLRAGATAYARLMRRLLFAPDVELRLDAAAAPFWLRPGPGGRGALAVLDVTNRTIEWSTGQLSEPTRNRLRDWRRAKIGHRDRPDVPSRSHGVRQGRS